jgi:hypothetical protein
LTNFFNSGTNGSYKDDMEQQPSGYKMAKETKSQDAISQQDYRKTNLLIEVS